MKRTALLAILAAIVVVGTGTLIEQGRSTAPSGAWWVGFLVLIPLGLGVLVWLGFRWAAMACVMYATVGLALDLATTVQMLAVGSDVSPPLMSNLVSGLLNFLLIVFGGRSFLDVAQAPSPQESHPPSPPSLS